MTTLSKMSPNPDYGKDPGVTRRHIRLTGRPNQVLVEMEDTMHGMRCLLHHDGRQITGVETDFIRVPLTACTGAGAPLQEIVGMPVGADLDTFFAGGRALYNCSHMFDITWLGVAHAARGETTRFYAAEVHDESNGEPAPAILSRDGEEILRWQILNHVLTAPPAMAGRHTRKGFTKALKAELQGDALEAAVVLHKACFIANVRRLIVPDGPVHPDDKQIMEGSCYSWSKERIHMAERQSSMRDFTDHPELLLQFR